MSSTKRMLIANLKAELNTYLDIYINDTDDSILDGISILDIINSLFLRIRDKYKHIIKQEYLYSA